MGLHGHERARCGSGRRGHDTNTGRNVRSQRQRVGSDREARPAPLDARPPHHSGRRRHPAVAATPTPRAAPAAAHLPGRGGHGSCSGSVVVVLASITFVGHLRERTELAMRKGGPVGSAGTTVASYSVDRRRRRAGRSRPHNECPNGVAHGIPLGDYAGRANAFGVAAFGWQPARCRRSPSDYLDKTDGWVAMDTAVNVKAWSPTHYHLVLGVPILPGVGNLGRKGPPVPTTSTSRSSGRISSATTRPMPSCAWGGSSTAHWFPWSVATAHRCRRTSCPTGARSSPPCGPCPAQKFKFLWNPNAPSPTSYTPAQAYPGNAYVDYVGTDVYDNFWGKPFTPSSRVGPPTDPAVGPRLAGGLRGRARQAHRHPRVVRRVPTRRPRPRGRPLVHRQHGRLVRDQQGGLRHVWSYDTSPAYRNNLLDGTFPKAWQRFEADFG